MSQKFWLAKVENREYWRGPEQVERVRQWRAVHSGYWRNESRHGVRYKTT